MKIFAISDTHLATGDPEKKMDRFGENWVNHDIQISCNWIRKVSNDDIVLLPGDISWYMNLDKALKDIQMLSSLPGEKVFVKGNHDFWWQSIKKVRDLTPDRTHFIQNNHIIFGSDLGKAATVAVGGTRLWGFEFAQWPCVLRNAELDEEAEKKEKPSKNWLGKVRKRELNRLCTSLESMPPLKFKIAMTHFPPIDEDGKPNIITDMMTEFGIDLCVFGHLHSVQGNPKGADCVIGKTRYVLVSADWIDFDPKEITL